MKKKKQKKKKRIQTALKNSIKIQIISNNSILAENEYLFQDIPSLR